MEFDFTIKHKKGDENMVINALSRHDIFACNLVTHQAQFRWLERIQLS